MAKALGVFAAFVLVLFSVRPAQAYPWMIRHEYTACAQCHADPSGAGLVTLYGRAQGEILLRTHYTNKTEDDPGRAATFLWGAIPLPDDVLVETVSRSAQYQYTQEVPGPGKPSVTSQFIQMQAELRAQVTEGKFRENASLGFAQLGDSTLTLNDLEGRAPFVQNNVISREHWIGYDATDSVLIRAGRMEVPYGIRDNTHTMYIHVETRDDIDQSQEYGLAAAYSGSTIRGEVMAVAGNFLDRNPAQRERGYYGYAEAVVVPKVAAGVSSLLCHSDSDLYLNVGTTRAADGVFLRASPVEPLVILAEDDMLIYSFNGNSISHEKMPVGSTGMLQADVEPIQGVHLIGATGWYEDLIPGQIGRNLEYWEGVEWFFASHTDVRLDFIQNSNPVGPNQTAHASSVIGQFHFYL